MPQSQHGQSPKAQQDAKILQVVGLIVANEEYAIDVLDIVAIERCVGVVKLPRMPESVVGLMSIRDEIVPLIELRTKFGFPEAEHGTQTRVVVINLDELTIGLVVDAVTRVHRLSNEAIQAAPPMALSIDSRFVRGVLRLPDGEMLVYLDPKKVIDDDKAREIGRARALAEHYVESD